MEECKAHDVDFRKANLAGGNFTYTDFANSVFGKTNLAGANFAEAVNYSMDILQNEVRGAKFSRFAAVGLLEGLGTRWGYGVAIIVWSVGALVHALAIPIGEGLSTMLGWVGITTFSGVTVRVTVAVEMSPSASVMV